MMHLFLNLLAASAGGGLTYARNVLPCFGARDDVRVTALVRSDLRGELGGWPNVEFISAPLLKGVPRRFWYEQRDLPHLIRNSGAHILLSAGNFALWRSPVPQILLSRNALYTSNDFQDDLRRRGDYRLWLDTALKAAAARASIGRADIIVAPSEAFARELQSWTGKNVHSIHHGFDPDAFTADHSPLPQEMDHKLAATAGGLRILFVSHYNYYRNFETLLRAIPRLRARLAPRSVNLVLTCRLQSDANPGSYQANSAAQLVRDLDVSQNVTELGTVPYKALHHVYKKCDVYVTPAYAESFAHPLVEAMSSGLPVVASDIPVHREICGQAALYFSRFSPEGCADAVLQAIAAPETLTRTGAARSQDFSWRAHTEHILDLARDLCSEDFAACSTPVPRL
jgi:glycosyltransferase involved in cell wall biosynthesis